MPNMLQYRSEETGKTTNFDAIDAEVCAMLGAPVHPTKFVLGWYDSVGTLHAMGKSQFEILEILSDQPDDGDQEATGLAHLRSITNYIHAYYTPVAWYQFK